MPVHLYGHPAAMDRADGRSPSRHGLAIFEDAGPGALRGGDGRSGRCVRTAGAFSFYPTKNMTTGEGGMVVRRGRGSPARVRLLRNQGMERRYENEVVGFNVRMTDVAAAIGRVQLDQVDRLDRAAPAQRGVPRRPPQGGGSTTPPVAPGRRARLPPVHRARADDRDGRAAAPHRPGVGTGVYYPTPIHRLPSFAKAPDVIWSCRRPNGPPNEVDLAAGAPVAVRRTTSIPGRGRGDRAVRDEGAARRPGRPRHDGPQPRTGAAEPGRVWSWSRSPTRPATRPVSRGGPDVSRTWTAGRRRHRPVRGRRTHRAARDRSAWSSHAAGVHALIEKPLGRARSEGAGELVAAFEAQGLVARSATSSAYNPALQALRSRLQAGELGELYQVSPAARARSPTASPTSAWSWTSPPTTSTLTAWVTGRDYASVSARTAHKSGREHEDLVAVVGQLDDGTVVNHLVNWLSPMKERVTVVTGDRGCFVADTLTADLTFYANASDPHGVGGHGVFRGVAEGDMIRFAIPKPEPLRTELTAFRDAILRSRDGAGA